MQMMKNHIFRDLGIVLGRSVRYILRSMDPGITVTIILIAFMLLFVFASLLLLFAYVFGSAIQTLEEIFFVLIEKREK
jgi:ABC-2 type transport system permease protein